MSDLDKLIEAVEAGRGDAVSIFTKRLSSAARDRGAYWPSHDVEKAFSGSLDAALALHKALLPYDWIAEVDTTGFALVYQDEMEVTNNAMALLPGCPARAWLLAILRAYRQQRGAGNE